MLGEEAATTNSCQRLQAWEKMLVAGGPESVKGLGFRVKGLGFSEGRVYLGKYRHILETEADA
jgi:hypothetical protein